MFAFSSLSAFCYKDLIWELKSVEERAIFSSSIPVYFLIFFFWLAESFKFDEYQFVIQSYIDSKE